MVYQGILDQLDKLYCWRENIQHIKRQNYGHNCKNCGHNLQNHCHNKIFHSKAKRRYKKHRFSFRPINNTPVNYSTAGPRSGCRLYSLAQTCCQKNSSRLKTIPFSMLSRRLYDSAPHSRRHSTSIELVVSSNFYMALHCQHSSEDLQ